MFSILKKIAIFIVLLVVCGCSQSQFNLSNVQSKGISILNNGTVGSNSSFSNSSSKGDLGDVKREALIIGISDYAPADRNDLDGIEKDISKIKKLFESWGFKVRVLYDAEAMKVLNYLDEYAKELDSNDYFAFYYSGHGAFKPDKSGDESDGRDETLVLSDGVINKHLPDDLLYDKFNKIKAKKLIFLDSCHSGTAFRSLNFNAKPKSISPSDVTESFEEPVKSRGLSMGKSSKDFIDGEYIVFSASQDNEESLATPTGSLFTNALYKTFMDNRYLDKPLKSIKDILTKDVIDYAKKTKNPPHHPNITFSELSLSSKSLDDFLNIKSKGSQNVKLNNKISTSQESSDDSLESLLDKLINSGKVEKMSISYDKTSYKEGESVHFTIDTGGKRGFLTIFFLDNEDITLLYPNPFVNVKQIEGKYRFPEDLSGGKFELEAYKSCKGCDSERTVVYALLTSEPVTDINQIKSKGILLSFSKESKDEKIITRAVKVKATESGSFKPELAKYEFIVKWHF